MGEGAEFVVGDWSNWRTRRLPSAAVAELQCIIDAHKVTLPRKQLLRVVPRQLLDGAVQLRVDIGRTQGGSR